MVGTVTDRGGLGGVGASESTESAEATELHTALQEAIDAGTEKLTVQELVDLLGVDQATAEEIIRVTGGSPEKILELIDNDGSEGISAEELDAFMNSAENMELFGKVFSSLEGMAETSPQTTVDDIVAKLVEDGVITSDQQEAVKAALTEGFGEGVPIDLSKDLGKVVSLVVAGATEGQVAGQTFTQDEFLQAVDNIDIADNEDVSVNTVMEKLAEELGLSPEETKKMMEDEDLQKIVAESLGLDPENFDPEQDKVNWGENKENFKQAAQENMDAAALKTAEMQMKMMQEMVNMAQEMAKAQEEISKGIRPDAEPVVTGGGGAGGAPSA